MSSEWLPGVVSAAALIIAAGVPLVGTLRSLKANKPVNDATADEKQAAANASNFTAQQGIINTLNAQLERRDEQLAKLEDRITALEKKLTWMTARVEERDEQHDLMVAQLRASEERSTAVRKSLRLMSDWLRDHYAAEHPGEEPQIQFFTFVDLGADDHTKRTNGGGS
jgi:predicted RNase H-like nuclease (RuvC/YqgF family)